MADGVAVIFLRFAENGRWSNSITAAILLVLYRGRAGYFAEDGHKWQSMTD
jgi:hypothetical protein